MDSNRSRLMLLGLCSSASSPAAPPLPSSLGDDLGNLLTDQTLADVTFVVDGELIMAHRLILMARSSHFRAMLAQGEGIARIEVYDTPVAPFRALLEYLYTDRLEFAHVELVDVMKLAHRYEITRVYEHCRETCESLINVDNAVEWLVQAHMHCLEDLRAKSLAILVESLRNHTVSEMGHILDPLIEHPELMLDILKAVSASC
eukprot:gnl/TRDRNA2_/TRDRNA2_89799_c2_seq1.p1 gnl/TRDRNA2_/TRDRNA2_89799_c2~~gnl/TRDRNA2_/TRDRNA2_89799_c2_seq1.p1  ORF type:complete len:225 (+),score=40.54 gnl/TRDRNA2_/TRDRNA2_89799_c2_seq1:69-677(+)